MFWAAKALLTLLTVTAGFVGGEVTPLLVTGAAFGSALAGPLGLPVAMAAAAAMAGLLAAAAALPLTLAVLAVEWFGWGAWPHVPLVCVVAWRLRGSRSLYAAPAPGVVASDRSR
jgi:H+/Cl- antiporter ClcA